MIQCCVPNVTESDESQTVRMILMGLINHPTYGPSATNMFSTDLPNTIGNAKKRLESHAIMLSEIPNDSRNKGMQAPSKNANDRIPEDIYNAMNRLLDLKLSNFKRENRHDGGGQKQGGSNNNRRNNRARKA